uniref:Uncharacterized protein n=1 Tax=Syphacia muris TaxID=451379 RepID=A0A0N5AY84_9BILA
MEVEGSEGNEKHKEKKVQEQLEAIEETTESTSSSVLCSAVAAAAAAADADADADADDDADDDTDASAAAATAAVLLQAYVLNDDGGDDGSCGRTDAHTAVQRPQKLPLASPATVALRTMTAFGADPGRQIHIHRADSNDNCR